MYFCSTFGIRKKMKIALIVGATGLVGSFCLQKLLQSNDYERVMALVRRPTGYQHPKLQEHIVDFDNLAASAHLMFADDVFCCLGTTINKAGSQARFRKVDYEYPLAIAQFALQNGAKQYLIITAIGADSKSLFFYNRVKGEVEIALKKLSFETLHILRPSLLLGSRNEHRLLESWGIAAFKTLGSAMIGPLAKYRGIEADVVAQTMFTLAQQKMKGQYIHESDAIQVFIDRPSL